MLDWKKREACSQSFYQENILIIKTFCPFVLLSIIIICSYVLLSRIKLSGRSTGYLRGMYGKCLNNISRCSNPLHIDVLRILREMLPSFVKFMINKWNPTKYFSIHLELSKQFYIFANE